MEIQLNGESRDVEEETTLADLLELLSLDRRAVVVEHNREIVRRDGLDGRELEPGDRVEIVHVVGGGRG